MSASTRRTYALTILMGLAGGALVAVCASRPWAIAVTHQAGIPALPVRVDGTDAVPLVGALGLVILAGTVASVATAGVARRIAGLAIAASGLVCCWLTLSAGSEISSALADQMVGTVGGGHAPASADTWSVWRWLSLAGAVLSLLAGLLIAKLGPGWPAMGSKYDAPTAPRARDDSEPDLWRALDAGEDPTT